MYKTHMIDRIGSLIPDSIYIRMKFFHHLKKLPDLNNPKTFNEKLQWLKLHDRRPEYTLMVDKILAKDYVAGIIGSDHIIPILGVWNDPKEIDFSTLPDQFVLKCNHDSKSGVVCKDKAALNIQEAIKTLEKGLRRNGYWYGREWPYKNVERKVFAEEYLSDSDSSDQLTDYKFYCFNGVPDCVLGCYERNTGHPKFYFFDRDWNLKRYNKNGKEAPEDFSMPKPDNLDEMFQIAEKLAKDVDAPFLRVDLYSVEGKTYFGELTFYPDSGFDANRLPETDLYFGSLVKLPIDE